MRKRSRQTGRPITPDLLDQAHASLGPGADTVTVADALFDAALRALDEVPHFHPARWEMAVRHFEKLAALYERIQNETTASDGGPVIAGQASHGRSREPQPKNKPGLAVPRP